MSGPEDRRPPDDRELEDFLAGRGPHHARYRAASAERAPETLDAAVLAQARAAVATARAPRRSRWRLPLSIAATLVLGVGLVSRLQHEAPPPGEPAPVVQALSEVEQALPALASAASVAEQEAPSAEVMAHQDAVATFVPPPPPPAPDVQLDAKRQAAEKEARRAARAKAQQAQRERRMDAAPRAYAAPPPALLRAMPAPPPPIAEDAVAAAAPPAGFASGAFRAEQGAELLLREDGGFELRTMDTDVPQVLSGQRRREGGVEVLEPELPTADSCRYTLRAEGEALRLESDCAGIWSGLYRPR